MYNASRKLSSLVEEYLQKLYKAKTEGAPTLDVKLYYVVIFFGWNQAQDVHCKIWDVLKKTASVKFLTQYSFEEFMFAYSGCRFSWTFRKLFDQGRHSQGWQAFIVNDCSASMLVNHTNTKEFLSSITRFFSVYRTETRKINLDVC